MKMMTERYRPTYWSDKGELQKEYELLFDELVPPEGEAKTVAGEALRALSKIYYDVYNNGACNMFDQVPHPYQDGFTDELVVNIRAENLLSSIRPHDARQEMKSVLEFISERGAEHFFRYEDGALDRAVTSVIRWAMEQQETVSKNA
jgi:hypothetical protein|tara:strand:- start:316 stop:756 length:441 start_codon:yes stop_codon:yes gene_type:complete